MVTAFSMPDGLDGQKVYATLRDRHGIVLAGGQGRLRGKIMRIGHMGYMNEFDIDHRARRASSWRSAELGYTPPAHGCRGRGGAPGVRRVSDGRLRVLVKEKIAQAGVDLLSERFDVDLGIDWPAEELTAADR